MQAEGQIGTIKWRLSLVFGNWEHLGNFHLRGSIWHHNNRQTPEEIVNSFPSSPIDIETFLRSSNGFYSIIRFENSQIFAAVDHVRSIPLYYAIRDGVFYLSDNAEWLRLELVQCNI